MSRTVIVLLAGLLLTGTVAACGKKGDLERPPGAQPAAGQDTTDNKKRKP